MIKCIYRRERDYADRLSGFSRAKIINWKTAVPVFYHYVERECQEPDPLSCCLGTVPVLVLWFKHLLLLSVEEKQSLKDTHIKVFTYPVECDVPVAMWTLKWSDHPFWMMYLIEDINRLIFLSYFVCWFKEKKILHSRLFFFRQDNYQKCFLLQNWIIGWAFYSLNFFF